MKNSYSVASLPERRYDFDWLRVLVFGLLIFYHTGLIFGHFWFITNNESSQVVIAITEFTSQWRMPLLFIISGVGVSFALRRRSGLLFLRERIQRLLIPLLFGSLFITTPQFYYEKLFKGEQVASYIDFQVQVFELLTLPQVKINWAHLWFLAYLLVYSVATLPFFLFLRSNAGKSILNKLSVLLLQKNWLILGLVGPLVMADSLSEFYLNGAGSRGTIFLLYFVYGYIFFSVDQLSRMLQGYRRYTLCTALFTATVYYILETNFLSPDLTGILVVKVLKHINSLLWIFTIIGYSRTYLNFQHSFLLYANEAVYPFYILHQTVMVLIAFYIVRTDAGIASKFILISFGTFIISFIIYEFIIRRFSVMRFLFGLKPKPTVRSIPVYAN